jgi:ADP-heptose:LPS heptosyltransferase
MIPSSIIISRTDNLGDVMLTLPLCGYIKKIAPETKIYFLGKSYTKPLIDASKFVDEFVFFDEEKTVLPHAECIVHVFPSKVVSKLSKAQKIPLRVGTSHRLYHWKYCNKLVGLSRRKSPLHESQLNILLFQMAFGIKEIVPLEEIKKLYGFKKTNEGSIQKFLSREKKNIILHPKSKGSAREWPINSYFNLAKKLGENYNILVTGTEVEGNLIKKEAPDFFKENNIKDLTGKISLGELVSLIQNVDSIVACSTGPIHIAAASGIQTIGIYPPMKPIHPARWSPQGENVQVLFKDVECSDCRKTQNCHCIQSIEVNTVSNLLL